MLAAVSIAAFGADPWKTKKPAEWTDKEAAQILNDSPWAKKASAEIGFGSMGSPSGGMGGPGGGKGGPGGGMGGPGGGMGGPGGGMGGPGGGMGGPGGGMGGPGGGMQAPKIIVRWESAEPVQEALNRVESVAAGKLAEWTKDFYVVSTSGMSMMRRGGRAGGQSGSPQPDPSRVEQMRQRMREVTSLKRKGKDPIAPERIETIESAGGMLTFFLFPRSAQISLEDKEITFQTSLGPMAVKAKFNLKDMQYQGKLAL